MNTLDWFFGDFLNQSNQHYDCKYDGTKLLYVSRYVKLGSFANYN